MFKQEAKCACVIHDLIYFFEFLKLSKVIRRGLECALAVTELLFMGVSEHQLGHMENKRHQKNLAY